MMVGLEFEWIFPLFLLSLMAVVGALLLSRAFRERQPAFSHMRPLDPLIMVRERYAQGLIAKPEFDQIVQDLVRTEDALGMVGEREQASADQRRVARRPVALPSDQNGGSGCACGCGDRHAWYPDR